MLRSSFQRLSRINDERGTRAVYEALTRTDLDVHVYGLPDWNPPTEFDVTTHTGTSVDYTDSWFVVYTNPATPEKNAALCAVRTEDEWVGFWTYDPELVADIDSYVLAEM